MGSSLNEIQFAVLDYIVFLAVLGVSLGIGIFYGFRNKQTTEEFLLAGSSMPILPVAMSMIATTVSSISLLGSTLFFY